MATRKGPRRLFLHVGSHKTGTTSVQEAMIKVAGPLSGRGIAAWIDPLATGRQANAFRLAHAFIRPDLVTPMRAQARVGASEGRAAIGDFLRHVNASPRNDHLVSAEAFTFLRTDAELAHLTTVVAPLFDVIVPILVLRAPDAWRASYAAEMARVYRPFVGARPLPEACRADAEWYFDVAAIRSFWGRVGQVAEIDYDRATGNDGTIISAVFAVLGCEDLVASLAIHKNRTPQLQTLDRTVR